MSGLNLSTPGKYMITAKPSERAAQRSDIY